MVSPYTSSSVSVVGASGNADIDSLLSLQKWGGSVGTGMTLTYSFPTGGATWDNSYDGREPDLGFAPLSDQEQASVIKALRLWSEVANITFVKANETSVPDKNVGDLRFGKTNMISNDANAGGYLPSSSPFGGDVWLSNTFFDGSDISADGSYKFFILLHEIGHAIGLKHPHEPVDPGSGLGTGITVTDDWLGTTAMSYRDHLNDDPGSVNAGFYPSTPMLNDIRAMQYLYGVNTTTRANSTTYSWEPGERLFETLYDRGGTDTIDWSNQASSAVIRLRAGEWSELGQPYTYFGQLPGNSGTFSGTMMIAPGVDIENANGGAGDDTISGNSAANILRGNGGADWLDGGAGADRLMGGPGDDTYVVDNASDATIEGELALTQTVSSVPLVSPAGGIDTVQANLSWTLAVDVENLILLGSGNLNGTGNGLANAITGNGGMNFLSGHDGSDNLLGLGGNDQLFGGNGDDILRGGTGVDVLTGNGGADRFIFDDLETAVGSRADRIADFSAAQGDLIDLSLIDANTTTLGDSFFTYLGGRPFQSGLAPGQLRYVADGADVILQGSTNTDTAAEFEIRLANLSTPPLTGNLLL